MDTRSPQSPRGGATGLEWHSELVCERKRDNHRPSLKAGDEHNDITRRDWNESPVRRQVETSALDEEACGFQSEDLIADAEVRRFEPLNDHNHRLLVPSQDEGNQHGHQNTAKLRSVAPRVARELLAVRHRYVKVTAALVSRVHSRTEGAVPVVFALVRNTFVIASVRVTVPTRNVTTLFVRPTVLNRDAKHLAGSKRDQALHEEQEHGDEFDNGGWHGKGIGLIDDTT